MDKCSMCGGKITEALVDTDVSGFKIKVKTYKCDNCGEEFMEDIR